MPLTLMQRDLEVPDVEKLARAFRVLPELTSLDAQTAANDAYGILWRGLDPDKAGRLQTALREQGVETEVVDEADLPALSPGRIVRRIELLDGLLNVHDPMGRVTPLALNQVLLIAAGNVRVREHKKVKSTLEESASHAAGGTYDLLSEGRTRETEVEYLMLELFLVGGPMRFSFAMDEFAFDYLGARLSDDRAINFMFLIQDLERNAPHASLNRGAFFACQKPPYLFSYPSKQTFNEELIWMLWRIEQLSREQGAEI